MRTYSSSDEEVDAAAEVIDTAESLRVAFSVPRSAGTDGWCVGVGVEVGGLLGL